MLVKIQDSENPRITWELDLTQNTRTMRDPDSGQLVKMDLGQPDVHLDMALANYAAGYQFADQGCIADSMCPVAPVPHASDKYFTWDKDDVFQDAEDLIVGPGGAVKEISPRVSSASFTTLPYGIGSFVPSELEGNADAPLRPYQAAMRRVLNVLRLGRERRVAALLTTTGNWSGGYTTTLGATAKWNAGSASNPVQDIYTAVESSLTPVNAIAMSEQVWHDFVQNAQVQKYTGYKANIVPVPPSAGTREFAPQNAAASEYVGLLGLPPLFIGTRKGKTSSGYGYVWGNDVVLAYIEPNMPQDGQSISTAKTFRWTGADNKAPDGAVSGGFLVRTYFDPRRGSRGGKMVVAVHNDVELMTSVFAGGVIKAAHQ